MTKLPDRSLLDGTKSPETTTGEFRLAMGNLRQYLFELLGDEGTDKETARLALGIDLAELIGKIAEKAGRTDVETALALKADLTELSGVAFTGNYNDLIDKLEKSTTLEGYGILVDSVPTALSTRPVTSNGIKEYVDNKIDSMLVPHGKEVFTSNGTFVVPARVTSVKVRICGGGGGSRAYQNGGSDGGASSFGNYVTVTGGKVGGATGGTFSFASNVSGIGINGALDSFIIENGNRLGGSCPLGFSATTGGTGYGYGGSTKNPFNCAGGSAAGYADVLVNVTPHETIAVTIGAAGSGPWGNFWSYGNAGGAGICIVEW